VQHERNWTQKLDTETGHRNWAQKLVTETGHRNLSMRDEDGEGPVHRPLWQFMYIEVADNRMLLHRRFSSQQLKTLNLQFRSRTHGGNFVVQQSSMVSAYECLRGKVCTYEVRKSA
jgi:hypothetical protein